MTIDMKDVSLRRNGFKILNDINWKVQPGEHWAIIGLNGSGKTTLLKILTGYISPSKGEVTVLGKKFGTYDLRELRKSIGWVSSSLQEALYENETVEEIVLSGKFATIGLYDEPETADINRAKDLLEQFGCSNLSRRFYYTLSQGEKQKIVLARALMNNPKLLILDEPCTGLDIFARESFLSLVEKIAGMETAPVILYVSHHIEEILPVFSYTMLIQSGSIYASGKTEDVLTENNLKNFYGKSVNFEWKNERPWIHVEI